MKKNRVVELFSSILFLAVLLGISVATIQSVGILSQPDTEAVYWERARYLLGEGGAGYYSGSSLCSLGYSLLLLPICMLLKSPYAAYKAAILLNGIFVCGAYLTALAASKKLFAEEHPLFLSAACFFSVFCPVYALARTYTGPEMAVLFLTWCSIYLLTSLWRRAGRVSLILLAFCLCLIGFLQISALGLILAEVIFLSVLVKKKRITANSFLWFLLALLLGLAAGNAAEQIVLYGFVEKLNITTITVPQSSLEVLLDRITTAQETGYLADLALSLAGKLYSVTVGSFLLVCPALFCFIRLLRNRRAVPASKEQRLLPAAGIIGVCLFQILWMAFYTRTASLSEGLISLSGMEMVLSPLFVMGLIYGKKTQKYWKEWMLSLLLLFGSAYFVMDAFQSDNTETIAAAGSGFLTLFLGHAGTPAIMVMLAASAILLTVILLTILLGNVNVRGRLRNALNVTGLTAVFFIFAVLNILTIRKNAVRSAEDYGRTVAPAASVLSEMSDAWEIVYCSDDTADSDILILQSLIPDRPIRPADGNEADSKDFLHSLSSADENLILITSADADYTEKLFAENPGGYELVCIAGKYAVWAQKDSSAYNKLAESTLSRPEYLTLKSEKTKEGSSSEGEAALSSTVQTYGGDLVLAPGTYRFEIYLHTDYSEPTSGTITAADADGTICSASFTNLIFDENGDGVMSIDFTGRRILRNITFTVEGTMLSVSSVSQAYFWKCSSGYAVGADDTENVKNAADVIRKLEENNGPAGTVAYVDDLASESDELSMSVFEDYLPGYEISAVTRTELDDLDTDFLIGNTDAHSYYTLMDRYSILSRGSKYTVLVRRNSPQYQTCLEQYGELLSDGTKIRFEAFADDSTKPFSLEMGSYTFYINIMYDPDSLTGTGKETAATLYIQDQGNILSCTEITFGELQSSGNGNAELLIPLYLSSKAEALTCTVEPGGAADLEATLTAIELAAENYQYGREEAALAELFSPVNTLEADFTLSVIQTDVNLQNHLIDYTWLQELASGCALQELGIDDALSLTEDSLLLTCGLSADLLELLEEYCILGHSGQYTLWARRNGASLQKLTEAGASVLSSGTMISPASLAAMAGTKSTDNIIAWLPSAKYQVYLELTVKDPDSDDTVEVSLLRDKTAKEIQSEIKALMEESGCTEQEAQEVIDPQITCESASYQTCEFNGTNHLMTVITTTGKKSLRNLTCDVRTWRGGEAEGKIVWIELK